MRSEQVQIDGIKITGIRHDTTCIEDFYIVLRDHVNDAPPWRDLATNP